MERAQREGRGIRHTASSKDSSESWGGGQASSREDPPHTPSPLINLPCLSSQVPTSPCVSWGWGR